MVRRNHALAQLLQFRGITDQIAELRLAEQEYLQQGRRAKLEVGQHPQFFQRIDRKILRLIHHQKAAATAARFGMQEILDALQRRGLVQPACVDAEGFRRHMDHIQAIKLAGNNGCRCQAGLVHTLHQMADKRRFACADFAGDDNEAFALCKTIAKIGQCLAMRRAFKIELRVRRKLKWASG